MSFDQLETLYRQVIMDHYKRPRNKGVLQDGSLTVDEQSDLRRPDPPDDENRRRQSG